MNNDVIEIEGIEENFATIEGLENGSLEVEGMFGSFFSKVKNVAKSATKPFVSALSPIVKLAETIPTPLLSAINPLAGTVKIASSLFDDMEKIEKSSGKKFSLRPKFGKNIYNTAYAKGYKDAVTDYESGKLKIKNGTSEVVSTVKKNSRSSRRR